MWSGQVPFKSVNQADAIVAACDSKKHSVSVKWTFPGIHSYERFRLPGSSK